MFAMLTLSLGVIARLCSMTVSLPGHFHYYLEFQTFTKTKGSCPRDYH